MKVSVVTVVGLLLVTFVFWIGQAEAQHRGGRGKVAVSHPPKGGARPGAGKAHPVQPKAKSQQKAKGGIAKPAQKKEKHKESAKAKHDEKKKHLAKEKAKAEKHAKKTEKKAPATKGGPDHESISLLRAVHHKLHESDHDYDGHRHWALEHVGSALGHLGSSAEAPDPVRTGPQELAAVGVRRHHAGGQGKPGDDQESVRHRDCRSQGSWRSTWRRGRRHSRDRFGIGRPLSELAFESPGGIRGQPPNLQIVSSSSGMSRSRELLTTVLPPCTSRLTGV